MITLLLDIAPFGRRPKPRKQEWLNENEFRPPSYPQTAEDTLSVEQLQQQFEQLDSTESSITSDSWQWASSSVQGTNIDIWIVLSLVTLGTIVIAYTYFKRHR